MEIKQHVPAGFASWTEYYNRNNSLLNVRNWIDGILCSAVLLLALSIESIVDAIL